MLLPSAGRCLVLTWAILPCACEAMLGANKSYAATAPGKGLSTCICSPFFHGHGGAECER
eukprot:3940467-Rhodomonas_salina.1